MNKTIYGTTPIVWLQPGNELYASVGNVRLRIATEAVFSATFGEQVYSASLALLTANGWTVVKHVERREESMAISNIQDAADMFYGLPASCDDPWVKLNEKSSLYARLDGQFLVEMKCFDYFERSWGVSLFVFNQRNQWSYVHNIAAYSEREQVDTEAHEARIAEATEKMKEFAAIMFLNRLTSPV